MYLNRHRQHILCKLIVFETVLKIGNPFATMLQLRKAIFDLFSSTNGCRIDTNDLLSFLSYFKILNLSMKLHSFKNIIFIALYLLVAVLVSFGQKQGSSRNVYMFIFKLKR